MPTNASSVPGCALSQASRDFVTVEGEGVRWGRRVGVNAPGWTVRQLLFLISVPPQRVSVHLWYLGQWPGLVLLIFMPSGIRLLSQARGELQTPLQVSLSQLATFSPGFPSLGRAEVIVIRSQWTNTLALRANTGLTGFW